jgi:sec-independent protein translocase protein TatC
MSAKEPFTPDPDDLFAHTRMSLGDHIEELRGAMLRAGKGFLLALVVGFFFAQPILSFIEYPVKAELEKFYDARIQRKERELKELSERDPNNQDAQPHPLEVEVELRQLEKALGVAESSASQGRIDLTLYVKPEKFIGFNQRASRILNQERLIALTITEPFTVWCQVSVYTGLVLASPWIFYQLWMFVAAGLYPHEKRYVYIFLPFSLTLFLAGVALCQFVVLPLGIHYLLWFADWLGVEPELRLNDWLGFAIMMPVIFGLAFQMPLVMFFLYRAGIVEVETYTKAWRMAIFIVTIIGFMMAPSPDPLSGLSLAIPLILLYFLGIWLCKTWPRPELDLGEPDPSEMVEV